MKEKIVFKPRTGIIQEVSKMRASGSRSKQVGLRIHMDNGDNMIFYPQSKNQSEGMIPDMEITYILEKTKVKNKVTNIMKLVEVVEKEVKKRQYTASVKALQGIHPRNFLFMDIETARIQDKLTTNTELFKSWEYKRRKEGETLVKDLKKSFEHKAALYAEFGKVVCISIGKIVDEKLVVQSYYGDDEKEVLEKIKKVLTAFYKKFPDLMLCGHSIIGFDIPFLMRRMIINGIQVPSFLDLTTSKPWTLSDDIVDIAQIWKTTGFYGASLVNMSHAMGLPSPKEDIDGSMVSDTYYREKDGLKRIVKYCEQDVFATVNIVQKLYLSEIFDTFTSKTFEDE